jgi:trans-aconitate methyltransferase
MELSVAKKLIEKGIEQNKNVQHWADLGAGEGLFTKALASLLPGKSTLLAIDRDARALRNIKLGNEDIELQTIIADLNDLPKKIPVLDGIVMANSLHYIEDQINFLSRLKKNYLKLSGVIILVEYDLEKSNPWVPFPVSKNRLRDLSVRSGFDSPSFFHAVKSKLNSTEIYSALLKPLE